MTISNRHLVWLKRSRKTTAIYHSIDICLVMNATVAAKGDHLHRKFVSSAKQSKIDIKNHCVVTSLSSIVVVSLLIVKNRTVCMWFFIPFGSVFIRMHFVDWPTILRTLCKIILIYDQLTCDRRDCVAIIITETKGGKVQFYTILVLCMPVCSCSLTVRLLFPKHRLIFCIIKRYLVEHFQMNRKET